VWILDPLHCNLPPVDSSLDICGTHAIGTLPLYEEPVFEIQSNAYLWNAASALPANFRIDFDPLAYMNENAADNNLRDNPRAVQFQVPRWSDSYKTGRVSTFHGLSPYAPCSI